MKTINNIQKAAFKFTAVIASLVLISLTVSAQDLWKELINNEHLKEIAFAMVENPKEHKTITSDKNLSFSVYSELIEESIEETLELETWMTDNVIFIGTSLQLKVETENPMELENWMMNHEIFNRQLLDTKSQIEVDSEEELTLENWMLDDNIWNK